MNMCQSHWDKLREAIKERGLSSLVADSGEKAASNMTRQLQGEEETIDTYDPLMSAYWAVCSNAMDYIGNVGGNPLVLMSPPDPENPLPFEQCVICYFTWLLEEHDRRCKDPECKKPKDNDTLKLDWMIDRAADDQVERWKELNA